MQLSIAPLMIDLEGLSLTKADRSRLNSEVVGGVILFSRNYQGLTQLSALMAEIRELRPDILVCVDHEGGRVQRFKEGFTRIPAMSKLGDLYRQDVRLGVELAKDCGWLLASELSVFDIDFSFTPVLDRDYGISEVIGDRAFGSEPEVIEVLASALCEGMREVGMASTGKHFPGHGAVAADSHLAIPYDERSLEEIVSSDGLIFQRLIENGLDAVMPAHVVYSQVDSQPAGFSSLWLQEVLRKRFGFDGVIFSDDLGMEGASVAGGFTSRAKSALSAGCDMILVCNNPAGADEVISFLESCPPITNQRLSRMKGSYSGPATMAELQGLDRWRLTAAKLQELL